MPERPHLEEPSEQSLREILVGVYGVPEKHLEDILGDDAAERFESFVVIHERLSLSDRDPDAPLPDSHTPEAWRHYTTQLFFEAEFNEGTSKVPGREILVNIFELWKEKGPTRAMEVVLNYYAFLDELTADHHLRSEEL